ncbi:C-C motif chemokine 2-like [Lampris incognitus]|uniref:C-C motif chemokine 2-like n=1 Tax=Lampris incognitus TaxID=2546036 RepID=UPI0024B4EE83|nr:C-C motif chemokine 2-like [Lampris incognitus]
MATRLSLVSPTCALLCLATWMGSVYTTHGPVDSCCENWSNTTVSVDKIVNYTIQSVARCSIPAVVFITKQDRTICSNPARCWAKKAMRKVDKENEVAPAEKKEEGKRNKDAGGLPEGSGLPECTQRRRGTRERMGQGIRPQGRKRKGLRV